MASDNPSSVVLASGATSGLNINLHPLAILNISDHYTRAVHTSNGSVSKLIGALLGSQTGRDVSIVNTFELVYTIDNKVIIDEEFFKERREQFSQVFPTQSVVGWYSIGSAPTADDVDLHAQVAASEAGPNLFVLFNPDMADDAQALPFTVYESALEGEGAGGRFVQLECGIETGEAERIAVDGITKEVGGDGDQTGRKAKVDYDVLRQIGALVATLPVMDATEFKTELQTEQNDVQLTDYLTTLLQQMEAWTTSDDIGQGRASKQSSMSHSGGGAGGIFHKAVPPGIAGRIRRGGRRG